MHQVALTRFDGSAEPLRKALELSGGLAALDPAGKVLVKPNLVWGGGKNDPPFGVVTTGILVDHLLQLLREHGCRRLSVGEGTVLNRELGSSTARAFEWSGIGRAAKRHGVPLVDFNAGLFDEVSLDGTKVLVAREALEAAAIVDVPVLKTHVQAKVTLGMKNLKGCLKLTSKMKFHHQDLHGLIALLAERLRPSLTVIDGIYALERGPDMSGRAHRANLIVAGRDLLGTDLTGAALLGLDPAEVDHLRLYAARAGRRASLEEVRVLGLPLSEAALPLPWRYDHEAPFRAAGITGITIQDPGDAFCSGCMILLTAFTAVFCKDNPGTALEGVEICGGRAVRPRPGSSRVVLLGQCAITANKHLKDAIKIEGCPPSILDTVLKMYRQILPAGRSARSLSIRALKNAGMKLGVYGESFPLFGDYRPPEFEPAHYGG